MKNFCYKFTIYGRPEVKKNSRTVVRNKYTGRMFPIKSKKLQGAEKNAKDDLLEQLPRAHNTGEVLPPFPLKGKISVQFLFYRDTNSAADLSNLYGLPEDALQAAGVIANDSLIESHDGSRKFYDPENPRTEIIITPFVK